MHYRLFRGILPEVFITAFFDLLLSVPGGSLLWPIRVDHLHVVAFDY